MELVPSRYLKGQKSRKSRRRVFHALFTSGGIPNEGDEATKTRPRKKIDFFVFGPIWMGPIPFFLTFHAEFKKFIFFEIRPKMTDSRGNFTTT